MKHQLFLTVIFLFFQVNFILAQNIEFTKENFPTKRSELRDALKNISDGDDLYNVRRYMDAIDYYLKSHGFNPNNANLNYKIGMSYLNSIDKEKGLEYLEKAYELNPKVTNDILYQLANGYHLTHDFDKAINNYNRFKSQLSPAQISEKGKMLDKFIQECDTGKELVKNPVRVFIDNIGANINTEYPEYSPIINADESVLIFTSRRPNTTGGGRDPEEQKYYEDIYISYRKANKEWRKAENPPSPTNTKQHDASVGLFPDGQQLLIYKGDRGGDLFLCELQGKNWSRPKRLSKRINTKYKESSASLSPDGRSLYFVSDRPNGFGGRDIYVSGMDEKGKWQKPKHLPSTINTPYDEESVFIHPDGKTLYFSSKGHNSMGGYDIFKSVHENGKWSVPENLGYPINTADDDVFFSLSASGRHGYYSSARPGGYGEQDIYVITFLGPEKPAVSNFEDNLIAWKTQPVSESVIEEVIEVGASLLLLKGLVLDDVSKKPVEANIILTDNEQNAVLAVFKSNSATGKYLVSLPSGRNYGIAVNAAQYLFHSENFIVPKDAGYKEIEKDIYLKSIAVGSTIVLNNIFFDFAKAILRPESKAELNRLTSLLNEYSLLKIEISGHTDNIGSAQYNQKLSEDRAKSVVDYLIENGIRTDRLKYKGYGFDKPISSNDTEEGRQQNRRTEFKVLEN